MFAAPVDGVERNGVIRFTQVRDQFLEAHESGPQTSVGDPIVDDQDACRTAGRPINRAIDRRRRSWIRRFVLSEFALPLHTDALDVSPKKSRANFGLGTRRFEMTDPRARLV